MKHLFSVVALTFVLLFGIAPPAAHAQYRNDPHWPCGESGSIPLPVCSSDANCRAEHAYAMGVIYKNGYCGEPKDSQRANEWFREADRLFEIVAQEAAQKEDARITGSLLMDHAEAESALLDALKLKPGAGIIDEKGNENPIERILDSRELIFAFAKSGYVNLDPERGEDYQHWHFLKKPAYIFGHEIVLIEEANQKNSVGCCANPGIAITMKVNGDTSALQNFAKRNKCQFSRDTDDTFALDELLPDAPEGTYAHLSCWERPCGFSECADDAH